jgi:putative addiction module component (TIGR02574 family)
MNTAFEILLADALKLDSNERIELVQFLLASLHEDTTLDEAWAVVVERRIADIDSGVEKTMPMSEALAQVRRNLK